MPRSPTLFSNPGLIDCAEPRANEPNGTPGGEPGGKVSGALLRGRRFNDPPFAPLSGENRDASSRADRVFGALHRDAAASMIAHGAPTHLIQAAVEAQRDRADLETFCKRAFHFASLDAVASPTLMIGPPGAGKSMAACRLAQRLLRAHGRAALIFMDRNRPDMELFVRVVAQKAGFDFYAESDLDACAYRLSALGDATPCVLDGIEISPKNVSKNDNIVHIIHKTQVEPVLILSAATAPNIIEPLLAQAVRVGARRVVTSQLDYCSSLGGLLTAASHDSIGWAALSDAPGPLEPLQDASVETLIHLLEAGNLNKMSG